MKLKTPNLLKNLSRSPFVSKFINILFVFGILSIRRELIALTFGASMNFAQTK